MPFYLALDVGGTKTEYVLADDTHEIARVRTSTIKRMRADATTASTHLDAALAELTSIAGVSMQSVTRTCVGTAGNTVPLVTDWLRESLQRRVGGELVIVGDVEIALDAAFFGGPGILVLAGTGSNVAGRRGDGTLLGAGGYGPALADQGSGHRIGQEALRAGFLARDGEQHSTLLTAAAAFWQLASEDDLVAHANTVPAPDFSRLTELVLRCAEDGDAVASAVLRKEGEDLGHLACLMARRLGASTSQPSTGTKAAPLAIAFAGSIMEKVLPVRTALIAFVQKQYPDIQTLDGVIDPLAGAIWRARGAHPR